MPSEFWLNRPISGLKSEAFGSASSPRWPPLRQSATGDGGSHGVPISVAEIATLRETPSDFISQVRTKKSLIFLNLVGQDLKKTLKKFAIGSNPIRLRMTTKKMFTLLLLTYVRDHVYLYLKSLGFAAVPVRLRPRAPTTSYAY